MSAPFVRLSAASLLVISVASASLACAAPEPGRASGPLAAPGAQMLAGEVVLDRRDDGAFLLGRVLPALPDGDADRVLVIRTRLGLQPLVPALEGTSALDARFVAGTIVVLGVDHVLRVLHDGSMVTLDSAVQAPLSVARSAVAYVRGEPPELEVARADVETRAAISLTQGMAPAWSPALSLDGREVVFVSGVLGWPRLHRIDASGRMTVLPATERSPSSPIAPRWEGDLLLFDDEAGSAAIELSTGRVIEAPQ